MAVSSFDPSDTYAADVCQSVLLHSTDMGPCLRRGDGQLFGEVAGSAYGITSVPSGAAV